MKSGDSGSLCLECGLCCNGVIFADGQLQPEDDASHLRSLGLKFAPNRQSTIGNRKFLQPCACFDGRNCNIYPDRPKYCREFECLLLKSLKAGHTDTAAALRVIRNARQRVEKVKRLLRDLGNTEEDLALSKRFRKVKRRLESSALDEDAAEKFGDLTLAVHDLNLLLGEAFYPAS